MLAQYVHALQGLIGPCLLISGLDVLLGSANRPSCRALRTGDRWRLAGILLGVGGAVVFAALRAAAVVDRRSTVNLPTLVCAVVLDVAVLAVALCAQPAMKRADERPAAVVALNVVAAGALAVTVFYAVPDVILQLTNFVEPGDSPFTSAMLVRLIGFALGVGTAVAVAAIIHTLWRTAARASFTVAVALLIAVQCVRHGLDLIALCTTMRLFVLHGAPFRMFIAVRNHALTLVIAQAAVYVIPAAASFIAGLRAAPPSADAVAARTAVATRRRAWTTAASAVLAIALVWLSLAWGNAKLSEVPELSPPEQYAIADGVATIPFAQVEDGHLHRFAYTAEDGTPMRFIVIKKNGGAYGVGLDACETCGDAGYYEKNGKIICKRCDVAINLATIGFKGGCNPVPVTYKAGNGAIEIETGALDALSSHFA